MQQTITSITSITSNSTLWSRERDDLTLTLNTLLKVKPGDALLLKQPKNPRVLSKLYETPNSKEYVYPASSYALVIAVDVSWSFCLIDDKLGWINLFEVESIYHH